MAGSDIATIDEFVLVTDSDLARARQDAGFRQRLVSDNLERLLAALNHLRNSNERGQAELADLLQRITRDGEAPHTA